MNSYRPTALAILSDKEQGLAALRCVHTNRTPLRLLIKEMPGEIIHITLHANRTPLRLLIKEMPGEIIHITLHANDTFLRHWIVIKVELNSLSLTRFNVVVPSFSCASTLACGL